MDTGAAREQILQARSQIADAKSQAQSLRTENQTIQEKLNSARGQILSQRGLRSGRDINAVVVRNKQIGAIEQTEGQIAEREKAISQYESDIAVNEQAVNDYEEAVRDYEDRIQKQTQSDNTIYVEDVEQSLQMSLNPELRKKIDDELKKNKYQYSDDVVNRINSILGDRVKKPDITQIEEVKPLQAMSVTEPVTEKKEYVVFGFNLNKIIPQKTLDRNVGSRNYTIGETIVGKENPNYPISDTKSKPEMNIQTYADYKIKNALGTISEKIATIIPKGELKNTLTENKYTFSPSTLVTTSFFAPAMLTSTAALPKPTKSGIQVKVKPNDIIRETISDEQGNVFILEKLQQKPTFTSKDTIKPVIQNEQQMNVGRFVLTRKSPATYTNVYPSTPIKRLFFSPRQVQISPTRVDVARSTNIIVNEAGEIVNSAYIKSQRKGANLYSVSTVEGKQIPISPSEFNKLPEGVQRQLQILAERKTGVPVARENVPMMLNKDDLYSFGEVTNKKILTVSPKSKTATITPKGKRTSIGSVVSEAKPVLETDEFTIFKTKSGVRDISLPKNNRVNQIEINGQSLVFKNAQETEGTSSNILFNQQTKQKTDKVLKVVEKAKQTAAKNFPQIKPNLPKTTEESARPISEFVEATPVEKKSIYYGKGLYEKTEQTQAPLSVSSRTDTVLQPKTNELFDESFKNPSAFKENTKQNEILKEDLVFKNPNSLKQPQPEALKQPQPEINITIPKLAQKLVPKNPNTQNPRTIPRLNYYTNKYYPPIYRNNNVDRPNSKNIIKFISKFKVFVRRNKKDKAIGTEFDIDSARRKLKNYLKSDLSASGYVESDGEKIKASVLGLDREFTSAKRDQFRLVQKRGFRLGSGSEVNEIKMFKKRKEKKKLKWF